MPIPAYNCSAIDSHLINDCDEEILSGSNQIVLLTQDTQLTDPTNGTQIVAEIAAGRAVLVKNVKFSVDAPTAIEVDSNIACRAAKVVNYDRTAQLIDGNVNAHTVNNFYNSILNGRPLGGIVYYECAANRVTWINDVVQATGGRVFPPDDTEFQRVETTFKWRSLSEPVLYESVPAGIFY